MHLCLIILNININYLEGENWIDVFERTKVFLDYIIKNNIIN